MSDRVARKIIMAPQERPKITVPAGDGRVARKHRVAAAYRCGDIARLDVPAQTRAMHARGPDGIYVEQPLADGQAVAELWVPQEGEWTVRFDDGPAIVLHVGPPREQPAAVELIDEQAEIIRPRRALTSSN